MQIRVHFRMPKKALKLTRWGYFRSHRHKFLQNKALKIKKYRTSHIASEFEVLKIIYNFNGGTLRLVNNCKPI